MESKTDEIVEQRVVREVAGVVRTPEVLEKVVDALELNGFDRADIDVMADVETIRKRFGTVFVPVEEFADVPGAPSSIATISRWRELQRSLCCSRSARPSRRWVSWRPVAGWPPRLQRPLRRERLPGAWAPSPPGISEETGRS